MARALPRSVVEDLCNALEALPEYVPRGRRGVLLDAVPSQGARARVSGMLEAWGAAPSVSSTGLAWALRAASDVDEHHRHAQSIELVWTGPTPGGTLLRRTDQALLDLIRTARRTLYLVTFVAYKVPILNEATLAAARRGVEITLIFESPEASAGKTAFAGLEALGEELRDLSEVYLWPLERRPKDFAGRHGSLHAKFAVADEEALLVSSANLTEYALNLNMEMGLLVRGGDLPGRATGHLRRLMEENVLVPV